MSDHFRKQDHLLRPYLKGLPEVDLFPTEESFHEAIDEIERGMMPTSLVGWIVFVLWVAPLIIVPFWGSVWLLKLFLAPNSPWIGRLGFVIAIAIYCVIIFVLIRSDMPKTLRKQLVKHGVPVCVKCGYDLRGSAGPRCPECGRSLNARIRELQAAHRVTPGETGSRQT